MQRRIGSRSSRSTRRAIACAWRSHRSRPSSTRRARSNRRRRHVTRSPMRITRRSSPASAAAVETEIRSAQQTLVLAALRAEVDAAVQRFGAAQGGNAWPCPMQGAGQGRRSDERAVVRRRQDADRRDRQGVRGDATRRNHGASQVTLDEWAYTCDPGGPTYRTLPRTSASRPTLLLFDPCARLYWRSLSRSTDRRGRWFWSSGQRRRLDHRGD